MERDGAKKWHRAPLPGHITDKYGHFINKKLLTQENKDAYLRKHCPELLERYGSNNGNRTTADTRAATPTAVERRKHLTRPQRVVRHRYRSKRSPKSPSAETQTVTSEDAKKEKRRLKQQEMKAEREASAAFLKKQKEKFQKQYNAAAARRQER